MVRLIGKEHISKLQTRARDNRENQTYFSYLSNETMRYDPSLEPSRRDGSNEGHNIRQ